MPAATVFARRWPRVRFAVRVAFAATVVLAVAVLVWASFGAPSRSAATVARIRPNPFRAGRTLMIRHGGGDGMFPEDTIFAYEKNMALGGDVVDVDVSTSADGVPIAFHDSSVERTTNGRGLVATQTYAALAKLDAGWNFIVGGTHPYRGKGLHIPTVEAILRRFPRSLVTLDSKDKRVGAAAPVCALLMRLHRLGDVYVGSDRGSQVLAFRSTCPGVRTSCTDVERAAMRAAMSRPGATVSTTQRVSQPEFRNPNGTPRVTRDYIAFFHREGIAEVTWVVDDPKDMRTVIDLGVDGIYTRRAECADQSLHEMGKR